MKALCSIAVFAAFHPTAVAQPAGKLPAGISDPVVMAVAEGPLGRAVVFLDGGRQLATLTWDGVQVWDTKGKPLHVWPGGFLAVAASPDGQKVATIDRDNEVHLFDAIARKKKRQFRFDGVKPKPEFGWANDEAVLSFSRDNKLLAIGARKSVELWETAVPKLVYRFERSTNNDLGLGIIDFFPDNKRVACRGFRAVDIPIWDIAEKKQTEEIHLFKYVRSGKLSPDGRTFAAGIDFSSNRLCLASTAGRSNRQTRTPGVVNNIAFSPDGRVLVARCGNGQLLLIHVKSIQIVDTLVVNKADKTAFPMGLAFSPDGRWLAADNGGKILLWDVADWYKKLADYEKLTPARLDALWEDLARWTSDEDDHFEVPPVHQLLAVPDQAIELLARKLRPVPSPDAKEIDRLIRNLDSADFRVRDQASKALAKLDWLAKPALQAAVEKPPNLETKRRVEALLAVVSTIWTPEHQRQQRAVRILREIGSPRTREILTDVSRGAPGAYVTGIAMDALDQTKVSRRR